MRTMSHYLILMFTVVLFIFRLVVVFTTILGINFAVQSFNPRIEIVMLFIMLVCIILISKTKLIGGILYVLISVGYYGPYLLNVFMNISSSNITIDLFCQIIASLVGVIIPVFAFFIIALAKQQEKKPVDKKTDFFYKNEAYDRKYDERADKNNYRTM